MKLNVGSGGIKVKGWMGVDYSGAGWKGNNLSDDDMEINVNVAKEGLPFAMGTVEAIYSSHFIEHLNWYEGSFFLKECSRVCKSGAKIRLVCPDGDYFIKKFAEKDEDFFKDPERCYNSWKNNITDTFVWNFFGAGAYNERNYGCHSMFYNFENLSARLKHFGFRVNLTRQKFNESQFKTFLPENVFFKEDGFPRSAESSLFIEAEKE